MADVTQNFFDYVFGLSSFNPLSSLNLFLLSLARILPIVAITPFFGSKAIPAPVRMGFAICLAVVIFPHLLLTTKTVLEINFSFAGLFVKEVFIGLIFAFLASIPFWVAQSSGIVIDFMRGASSMIGQDPTMKNQVSTIGILYNQITIVIFFSLGGGALFLNTLMSSYLILPPDKILSPIFFAKGFPFWNQMIHMVAHIMAMALQLAAPAIVGSLMAEVFLGIANRLAPQVQIAFLGISIRSILAIALLFVGWLVILNQIGKETQLWLEKLQSVAHLLKY
jgi:type III secretion protein SpaR/YscT/HrcT